MVFAAACAEAAMTPEFVDNYNRLYGANLKFNAPKNALEAMIDKQCGYNGLDPDEVRKFAAFFYECVWSRLPDNCFQDMPPKQDGG